MLSLENHFKTLIISQRRGLCVYTKSEFPHTPFSYPGDRVKQNYLGKKMVGIQTSCIPASSFHNRGELLTLVITSIPFPFYVPGVQPVAHVCFDQTKNEVTEDQWCLELPQPLSEHKPCAMEPCLYRLVFLSSAQFLLFSAT